MTVIQKSEAIRHPCTLFYSETVRSRCPDELQWVESGTGQVQVTRRSAAMSQLVRWNHSSKPPIINSDLPYGLLGSACVCAHACVCVPCALMVDHTALQGDTSGALIRTTGERARGKVNERKRLSTLRLRLLPCGLVNQRGVNGKCKIRKHSVIMSGKLQAKKQK